MTLDTDKMFEKVNKANKKFRITLGDEIYLKLMDFRKPIKRIKHEQTYYYLYECHVYTRSEGIKNETVDQNIIVQFPIKTAWKELYLLLQQENKLNEKNLKIKIKKIDNYNWNITLV